MKIKILKPIRISEVGKTVLPVDDKETYDVSDSAGKILCKKGFTQEVDKAPSAAEIIEAIKIVTDVKQLEQYASDKRATVIKAIEEAKNRLKP